MNLKYYNIGNISKFLKFFYKCVVFGFDVLRSISFYFQFFSNVSQYAVTLPPFLEDNIGYKWFGTSPQDLRSFRVRRVILKDLHIKIFLFEQHGFLHLINSDNYSSLNSFSVTKVKPNNANTGKNWESMVVLLRSLA